MKHIKILAALTIMAAGLGLGTATANAVTVSEGISAGGASVDTTDTATLDSSGASYCASVLLGVTTPATGTSDLNQACVIALLG